MRASAFHPRNRTSARLAGPLIIAFALVFVLMAPEMWLVHPTLFPPLAFGVATVTIPFFIMQPSFGLGVAASRTPSPNGARLKSLMTHTVFGVGLYSWAYLLR